jgi:hypothetical protein
VPSLGKLQANPAVISIRKGIVNRKARLICMAGSQILDIINHLDDRYKANILSLSFNVKNDVKTN